MNFCEISQNTFFTEHLWATDSGFSLLASLWLLSFFLIELKYAMKILSLYIYPVLELVFVMVTSCSYYYTVKHILERKRNEKNEKKLERQLAHRKQYVIVYNKESYNRFKLFVPTLIVVTFLLFMVGPSILRLCFSLKILDEHDCTYKISFVFIPVGFITDPVIYIFSLKAVRLALSKMVASKDSFHSSGCL